jgi:hypothetical protein
MSILITLATCNPFGGTVLNNYHRYYTTLTTRVHSSLDMSDDKIEYGLNRNYNRSTKCPNNFRVVPLKVAIMHFQWIIFSCCITESNLRNIDNSSSTLQLNCEHTKIGTSFLIANYIRHVLETETSHILSFILA